MSSSSLASTGNSRSEAAAEAADLASFNTDLLARVQRVIEKATAAGKRVHAEFRWGVVPDGVREYRDGDKAVTRKYDGSAEIVIRVAKDGEKIKVEQASP